MMNKIKYFDMNGNPEKPQDRKLSDYSMIIEEAIEYKLDIDPMDGFSIVAAVWTDTKTPLTNTQIYDLYDYLCATLDIHENVAPF